MPLASSLALAFLAPAQTVTGPTLVADLETMPPTVIAESLPTRIGEDGSGVWFCARAFDEFRGVFYTDGTTAGTVELAWDGEAHSLDGGTSHALFPDGRIAFAGDLQQSAKIGLFVAGPGASGVERIVLDDAVNERVDGLTAWNGEVWFFATTSADGRELRHTDGTELGTGLGPELVPGPGTGFTDTEWMTVAGGKLFFTASFPTAGVYCMDTPTSAPVLLVSSGSTAQQLSMQMASLGNLCLFVYRQAGEGTELWVSDGTPGGTAPLGDLNPGPANSLPEFIGVDGGKLFFSAATADEGRELWVSDGTPGGTSMVVDYDPGPSSGLSWRNGTTWNGHAVLFMTDGAHGLEPVISDGTPAGTSLIADIADGSFGSFPFDEAFHGSYGGRLVFTARTEAFGFELFATDGTELGTEQIADFVPGPASNVIEPLGVTAAGVLVSADDEAIGREPWVTDGTALGTEVLAEPFAGADSLGSSPNAFVRVRDRLLFTADVEGFDREPWTSDGTEAGTSLLADWNPTGSSHFFPVVGLGDRLLVVDERSNALSLVITDGTESGTSEIGTYSIPPNHDAFAIGSEPVDGTALLVMLEIFDDGKTFFTETELWSTDGTPEGTGPLAQPLWPFGQNGTILPSAFPDGWLMHADLGVGLGAELYFTDGTPAGTFLLADIEPGSGSSSVVELGHSSQGTYFRATTAAEGRELWFTDGTPAGTSLVADILPGTGSSLPSSPYGAVLGDSLLFRATNGVDGSELWISDGTEAGTEMVLDVFPGPDSSYPHDFVRAGELMYFAVGDDDGERALWVTNGDPNRTAELLHARTIDGIAAGSGPTYVFVAEDPSTGWELWQTDGTVESTELALDLNPGFGDGNPSELTRVGGRVFLRGDDALHGTELHAVSLLDLGAWVAEPYGSGCGAELTSVGDAILGEDFTFGVTSDPAVSGFLFASVVPLWFGYGADCSIYVGAPFVELPIATDGTGLGLLPLTLPNVPELAGVGLYFQGIVLLSSSLGLTNGMELQIGAP